MENKHSYTIMFQGRAAETHLTRLGAVRAVPKLAKAKGWDESDLVVVKASPIGGN